AHGFVAVVQVAQSSAASSGGPTTVPGGAGTFAAASSSHHQTGAASGSNNQHQQGTAVSGQQHHGETVGVERPLDLEELVGESDRLQGVIRQLVEQSHIARRAKER
ncbi:unnamed protein product, partial [Amoebophrya sp. A25]